MTDQQPPIYAVVPAAGIGRRMQSDKPKQYLTLAGKTIIEHSIAPLLAHDQIKKVVVVIAKNDQRWHSLPIADHPKIMVTEGGRERCHSVYNGIRALKAYAYDNDWLLTHDACRPLLSHNDLQLLIDGLINDLVGGLLGKPIFATVKKVNADNQVTETVPRTKLWRAFTPQLFRYGLVERAIRELLPDQPTSDTAMAMELAGYQPRIVEARSDNIKLTCTTDLPWLEKLLQLKD